MIPLTLEQVADVVGGTLEPGSTDRVTSVVIDSRAVTPGALFVALEGERVDGHAYVESALERGAVGYLHRDGVDVGLPGGIAVDDPADALLGLGLWVRGEVDPTVVMVTGSNGKTTTKDLVAAAVGAERSVVATTGSQNNELGLPLTCCRLEPGTEVLVAEVGMRGLGQIAALAGPLTPDVAVVTNVAGVHLELLGSIDAIARAKAELVDALPPTGVAVLNADDARVAVMGEGRPVGVVTFGRAADATVRATDVTTDADARARFTLVDATDGGAQHLPVALGVPGIHNVGNALAAFAAARLCGVSAGGAVRGLELARVSQWRMELATNATGVRVLNDAYNANPDSTAAALRTLASMDVSGRRVAVLGHMAEIGSGEAAAHRDVGRLAAELDLDGLVVVGETARPLADGARDAGLSGDPGLHVAATPAEAATLVARLVGAGDAVLVKASRSAGLEAVAATLLEATTPGGGTRSGRDTDVGGQA